MLENTVHIADTGRSNSQTDAGTRRNGIGRSYKRIGTEVDIQHRTLSTFGQDPLAFLQSSVNIRLTVDQLKAFDKFNALKPFFFEARPVIGKTILLEQVFMTIDGALVFPVEILKHITYTQAAPAHLIGISRADTLSGSTNLCFAFSRFVGRIEEAVGG